MFVIMAVATDTRAVGQAAALAIGATVGLEALFAGPISGASMNPARSLGPAVVGGTWTALWIYLDRATHRGRACGALLSLAAPDESAAITCAHTRTHDLNRKSRRSQHLERSLI